jgi:hypothetical protein
MVEGADILLLFAQLAAVIAGFSGVVVALDVEPIRKWSRKRRNGLRSLLQVSAVVVVFSIVPLVLGRRLPEPALWTWALLAYGVGHFADVLTYLVHQERETPTEARAGAWTGLAIALSQVAAAALVSPSTAEIIYFGVLTWHLLIAAGSFAYLLYSHDSGRGG